MNNRHWLIILVLGTLVALAGCGSKSTVIQAGSANTTWTPVTATFSGVPMVKAPAGCFRIGRDNGPIEETPSRQVCLSTFWIGQTEVTNAQYAECARAGACTEPMNAVYLLAPSYADHPVVNVTWEQANAYARWRGGRLPSEAQWEYAARGPQGLPYPWGEQEPDCERANTGICVNSTAPVGPDQRPDGASWVGALDMAGNVWEWVDAWFQSDTYINWADGVTNPVGAETGQMRVLRGGSWGDSIEHARSTYRARHLPDAWSEQRGFRIILPGSAEPDK